MHSFTCCSYNPHTPPATDGDFHHITRNGECYMFAKSKSHSYSPVGSTRQAFTIHISSSPHLDKVTNFYQKLRTCAKEWIATLSKEMAKLTCEGVGATLLAVDSADVNEILVNATSESQI